MTSAKKQYTAAEKTKIALEAIKGQSWVKMVLTKPITIDCRLIR